MFLKVSPLSEWQNSPGSRKGSSICRRRPPLLPVRPNVECRAAFRQTARNIPAPGRQGHPGIHPPGGGVLGRFGFGHGTRPGRIVLDWPLPESHLPKAALVYFVQSQGNLRRTYLYGQPMDEMSPATISPLHVLDGAIVSGNFVMPSNKTCTYIHQNNPLIAEMFRQHGKTLSFEGVILSNEMSRLDDKQKAVQGILELINTCRFRVLSSTRRAAPTP